MNITQHSQSKSHVTTTRVQARRIITSNRDEARLELSIQQTPIHGKRMTWLLSSLILSPSDARHLALAICPELTPKE